MTQNLFSTIAEMDEDFKITSRESFLRKASKKMKEIEILKEKGKYHSLTVDECLKLEKEYFWKAYLYEEPETSKPNIKEERKRKKQEEQKRKKQEEQKQKEEEQKQKEEEHKRKIEEEEKQKREEEQKRKEEEKKRKKQEKKDKKIKQNGKSLSLEEEYRNLLLLHHGNNNKTFRLLSLKYHPDKNVGRQTWANEMQKKLVDCREMFSSF